MDNTNINSKTPLNKLKELEGTLSKYDFFQIKCGLIFRCKWSTNQWNDRVCGRVELSAAETAVLNQLISEQNSSDRREGWI